MSNQIQERRWGASRRVRGGGDGENPRVIRTDLEADRLCQVSGVWDHPRLAGDGGEGPEEQQVRGEEDAFCWASE